LGQKRTEIFGQKRSCIKFSPTNGPYRHRSPIIVVQWIGNIAPRIQNM